MHASALCIYIKITVQAYTVYSFHAKYNCINVHAL